MKSLDEEEEILSNKTLERKEKRFDEINQI